MLPKEGCRGGNPFHRGRARWLWDAFSVVSPALVVTCLAVAFLCLSSPSALASSNSGPSPQLTSSLFGLFSLLLFVLAYSLVVFTERLRLRRCKPVLLAAGVIWVMVALAYGAIGDHESAHEALRHSLFGYAELFLFLLVTMTYINAITERNVFQTLRSFLVRRGFTLRTVFWVTGFLAFVISPVIDNLTTAMLMGAVAMAVGGNNRTFRVVACINIVVAVNAGGSFSPFGGVTPLVVWQNGRVGFGEFVYLFIPALLNWMVPAALMSLSVSTERSEITATMVRAKPGSKRIMVLFLLTLVTAIFFNNILHLPPATGMMLGLAYLGVFSFYLKKKEGHLLVSDQPLDITSLSPDEHSDVAVPMQNGRPAQELGFDLFRRVAQAEWDTLLFCYGIALCMGGLGQFGYLAITSKYLYHNLGPTITNILLGLLSAVVDNISLIFAVQTMDPHMSHGHWLLVTLTVGVGGSLLSIGSTAGVALMGTNRDVYTFASHLKWTWVVALGYVVSIAAHLLINASLFRGSG